MQRSGEVGEGLRAAYVGAKVAADVAEHVAADVGEHALEQAAEHEAADVGEHAAGDAAASLCSFSAGTPVATPAGERPIGSLRVGDAVTAYDPSTGKSESEPIQHVWLNHDHDLVDVHLVPARGEWASDQATAAAGIKTPVIQSGSHGLLVGEDVTSAVHLASNPRADALASGETIHTTANHPWLTADRGWVAAGDLRLGEPVVTLGGGTSAVAWVYAVPGQADMYNLTIAKDHTYAVGDGQQVVHNNNCGPMAKGLLNALRRAGADVSHMVVGVGKTADGSLLVALNQRAAEEGVTDLTDKAAQVLTEDVLERPGWAKRGLRYVGPETLAPFGTPFGELPHAEVYLMDAGADPRSIEVSKITGSCQTCLDMMGLR